MQISTTLLLIDNFLNLFINTFLVPFFGVFFLPKFLFFMLELIGRVNSFILIILKFMNFPNLFLFKFETVFDFTFKDLFLEFFLSKDFILF